MRKLIAILALLLVAAQSNANGYGYGRSFGFRSYSFSAYRIATPYAPVAFSYAYPVPVAYPVAASYYGCGGCYGQAAQLPAYQPPVYQAPPCASQLPAYQPPLQAPCDQAAQLPAYDYAPPVATPYAAVGYSGYAAAFPYVSSYFRSYNYGFQRAFFSRRAVIHGRGFRGSSFNGFAGSGTAAVQVNNRGLFGRRQSVTAVAGGGGVAVQVNSRAGLFGRRQTSVTAVSGAGGVAVVQQRGRIRR